MFSPIWSAHFIETQNQLTAWTCHMTMPSAIISDMRLHKKKIKFPPIMYTSVWTDFSFNPHKLSYSVLCTFYIKTTTFFYTGFHQHTLWCTGFNGWKSCTHTKQQSINICEPCYSGIWSTVMTHFNTTVSTMCDGSNQPHSWQVTSPIAVLLCRSLSAQSSSVYH